MKMKTLTIPKEQKKIIVDGLSLFLSSREPSDHHTIFDLHGLIGLMKGDYTVTVEMTEEQSECFGSSHGVDCPEFIDDEYEEVEPNFDYITVEHDENSIGFDVKSNVKFEDSEDFDDEFISYNLVECGEGLIVKGTPYAILPTGKTSWNVLCNGEVVESIEIDRV